MTTIRNLPPLPAVCDGIGDYTADQMCAYAAAAVAAERERCAKVCDEQANTYFGGDEHRNACAACSHAIRGQR